jgi:hypothetical protein
MSSGAGAAAGDPVIVCTKCGAEIRLTESLAAPMLARERAAWQQQARAESAAAAEKGKLEAKRDFEARLKEADEVAAAKEKQIAELRKNELELRRERLKLEEAKQSLELDVARKVDAEKAKVKELAAKEFDERQKLKDEQQRLLDLEKDKLASDLKKQIADLQRKLEQGSQQLQGEVQELDLEARLREHFPRDAIEPVAKGVHGGDCVQRVHAPVGALAGSILWESKRTKAWSDLWLPKLRDDQRAARAELAVLMTANLPKGVECFGLVDGVWVTDAARAFPLAFVLRQSLIDLHGARVASTGRQSKMDDLYRYLTGTEFRHRVEAIVEAFSTMKEDLEAEKRAIERQWAKRDKQIERVLKSTLGMWGDLEGIAGKELPAIEGLDARQLEDGAAE